MSDLKNGTPEIESGDHKFTGNRLLKNAPEMYRRNKMN